MKYVFSGYTPTQLQQATVSKLCFFFILQWVKMKLKSSMQWSCVSQHGRKRKTEKPNTVVNKRLWRALRKKLQESTLFGFLWYALRTVSPNVTAHTFCASRVWSEIFKFLKEFAYQHKCICIFVRFKTLWQKQILSRAFRIQKGNWE